MKKGWKVVLCVCVCVCRLHRAEHNSFMSSSSSPTSVCSSRASFMIIFCAVSFPCFTRGPCSLLFSLLFSLSDKSGRDNPLPPADQRQNYWYSDSRLAPCVLRPPVCTGQPARRLLRMEERSRSLTTLLNALEIHLISWSEKEARKYAESCLRLISERLEIHALDCLRCFANWETNN